MARTKHHAWAGPNPRTVHHRGRESTRSRPGAQPQPDQGRDDSSSYESVIVDTSPSDHQDQGSEKPKGGSASQAPSEPARKTPRSPDNTTQPRSPVYCPYKYGSTNIVPELWQDQPRALLLFSGRPRDGDLASHLHEL